MAVEEIAYSVPGMSCGHCVDKAGYEVAGVSTGK
jgi:copper chaperone CopZ